MVYKFKYSPPKWYPFTYGLNSLIKINRQVKLLKPLSKLPDDYINDAKKASNHLILGYALSILLLYLLTLTHSVINFYEFVLIWLLVSYYNNAKFKLFCKQMHLKIATKRTIYVIYTTDRDKSQAITDVRDLKSCFNKKYNIRLVKMPKTIWFVYVASNYFICYTREGKIITVLPITSFNNFKEAYKIKHIDVDSKIKLPRPKPVI